MKAFLASIPHSGEQVEAEADWLQGLPETILMCDVDRFVDRLYQPVLDKLGVPVVITPYHRCMVDCNRWPEDVDRDSLEGSETPSGAHPTGLYWRVTTDGDQLLKKPVDRDKHERILSKYYQPFFKKIDSIYKQFRSQNAQMIYHLDLHSMPSQGTSVHRDPGGDRSDIVICTVDGQTAEEQWTQQVVAAYQDQGLRVSLNDPYKGGSIVQKYGRPQKGSQAIMVEINRKLYMDEKTKQWLPEKAKKLQDKLQQALSRIWQQLPSIET